MIFFFFIKLAYKIKTRERSQNCRKKTNKKQKMNCFFIKFWKNHKLKFLFTCELMSSSLLLMSQCFGHCALQPSDVW